MTDVFRPGERALLIDRRGRRYLIALKKGAQFHTHNGFVEHDAMLGSAPGTRVRASSGSALLAVRPTLAEFVLKMPRGAQVVYPKDIAAIVMGADVFPGAVVVEAGTGSGALALGLLRAVGEHGRLITYELRDEFAARARENIQAFFGRVPSSLEMRSGDLAAGIPETGVDRFVLDLAEPWRIVPVATAALAPGGIFCSYVPSVVQVAHVTEALRAAGFAEVQTTETLVRGWHVEGQSVRPDHRMVGHTGFVTTARLLGADPGEEDPVN